MARLFPGQTGRSPHGPLDVEEATGNPAAKARVKRLFEEHDDLAFFDRDDGPENPAIHSRMSHAE
jgi:hypothetical protein